jgi:hypothetical protein
MIDEIGPGSAGDGPLIDSDTFRCAVDHQLGADPAADLRLLRTRDHADRDPAAIEGELGA